MIQRTEQQKQITKGVTHAKEIVVVANRRSFTNHVGNPGHNNTVPSAFLAKSSTSKDTRKMARSLKMIDYVINVKDQVTPLISPST